MLGRVLPSLSLENLVSAWDRGAVGRLSPSPGPPGARVPSPAAPLMADLCPPGADHRYMNNYSNSYASEWSAPDTMKRYSMYLTPKGKRARCPSGPCTGRLSQVPPCRVTLTGFAWGSPGTYLLSWWNQVPSFSLRSIQVRNYQHLPLPASLPSSPCL